MANPYFDSYNAITGEANTARQNYFARQAGSDIAGGDYAGAANTLNKAGYLTDASKVQDQGDVQAKREAQGALTIANGIQGLIASGKSPQDAYQAAMQYAPMLGVDANHLAQLKPAFDKDPQGFLSFVKAQAQRKLQIVNRGQGGYDVVDLGSGNAVRSVAPTPEGKVIGDYYYPPLGAGAPTQVTPGAATPATPQPANAPAATKFDSGGFIKSFVLPHEGGLNPHDINGSPTNFGINQTANPGVDVTKLTPDQAAQIYQNKYLPTSGAANLPPALAGPVLDTAIINPSKAKQFLQQSGGDPNKFMDLREAWLGQLAQTPKGKPYAQAWAQRNADLRQYIAQNSGGSPTLQGGQGADTADEAPPMIPGYGTPVRVKSAAGGAQWVPDGKGNLINQKTGDRKVDPTFEATLAPNLQGLTGDALLKQLGPEASQVKALAEGRMAFPTGFAISKPYWQRMLQLVGQYDPTFDQANPTTRAATRKDFTSGKSAQNITALNTVIGHLDDLDRTIDQLGNFGPGAPGLSLGPLNALNNTAARVIARASGSDARYKEFETAKTAVANELTRVFRGTGGAEADIQKWQQQLDAASSPEALHSVVRQMASLINSRIEALGEQYNQGLGRSENPIRLLTPDKQRAFQRLMRAGQAAQASAPSQAAPSAPAGGQIIRYDAQGNRIQ